MAPIFQVLIVVGCIFLFVGSFLINRKIKLPDNTTPELPERCMNCHNEACLVKKDNPDEQTVKEIEEKCEEGKEDMVDEE